MNDKVFSTVTPYADGRIIAMVEHEFNGVRETFLRRVMDTQEEGIKQGLIQLGWTPPMSPEQRDNYLHNRWYYDPFETKEYLENINWRLISKLEQMLIINHVRLYASHARIMHYARVTELIEANNREVERRRAAEARVAHLELLEAGHRENAADDIADLTAQIDTARNEGLQMAIDAVEGITGDYPESTIEAFMDVIEALKSTAPVRDDAWALRLIEVAQRSVTASTDGDAIDYEYEDNESLLRNFEATWLLDLDTEERLAAFNTQDKP